MKKFFLVMLILAILVSSVPALADEFLYEGVVIATRISLRKTPKTSAERIDRLDNGTVMEVISETGDWSLVNANGKTGYVQSAYVTKYDYVVFREKAHVYAAPYSEKRVGGDRSAGEKYTLIDEYNDYYVINYGSGSGFVKKDVAVWKKEFIDKVKSYNNISATVTSDATLYSGPSNKWAKLGSVKNGEHVTVVAQEDGYYVIEYEDIVAYVSKSCVRFN